MPERIAILSILPVEFVHRLERKVHAAYNAVAEDGEQSATITIRVTVSRNVGSGDVEGTYRLQTLLQDVDAAEVGKIRDGQLTLPGTELRSDEAPFGDDLFGDGRHQASTGHSASTSQTVAAIAR